jgi:hypothetical protein
MSDKSAKQRNCREERVKERVNGDECYGSTLYTCIKIK